MIKTALLLSACALALPAAAQTVWRCGVDGRTFSDRPCVDAQRVELAGARLPTSAVNEALQIADRERRALKTLAQQRRAREAEGRQQGAAGIRRTAPEPAPARQPTRQPTRQPDRPFKATAVAGLAG